MLSYLSLGNRYYNHIYVGRYVLFPKFSILMRLIYISSYGVFTFNVNCLELLLTYCSLLFYQFLVNLYFLNSFASLQYVDFTTLLLYFDLVSLYAMTHFNFHNLILVKRQLSNAIFCLAESFVVITYFTNESLNQS